MPAILLALIAKSSGPLGWILRLVLEFLWDKAVEGGKWLVAYIEEQQRIADLKLKDEKLAAAYLEAVKLGKAISRDDRRALADRLLNRSDS